MWICLRLEASTSSVLVEKKRRCKQQRFRNATASDAVSSSIRKSLRSGPQRRTDCRFDEKPAVKVTRQSSKEMKRSKRSASGNIFDVDVKKSTKNNLKSEFFVF